MLGRSINVRTTADKETVRSIESFVNDKLAQVESSGNGDLQLTSILALLNIAEDYLNLLQECTSRREQESMRISDLLARVNSEVD